MESHKNVQTRIPLLPNQNVIKQKPSILQEEIDPYSTIYTLLFSMCATQMLSVYLTRYFFLYCKVCSAEKKYF
jgi:hypothetical protein